MNETALLIAATLASGTPLALAGMGLLLNEKAGVLNLGAEGMMLVAAVAGFAADIHARHPAMDVVMNIAGISAWGTVDTLTHQH